MKRGGGEYFFFFFKNWYYYEKKNLKVIFYKLIFSLFFLSRKEFFSTLRIKGLWLSRGEQRWWKPVFHRGAQLELKILRLSSFITNNFFVLFLASTWSSHFVSFWRPLNYPRHLYSQFNFSIFFSLSILLARDTWKSYISIVVCIYL